MNDLVPIVLVEAVGSSLTPFVPVPFVDDYLLERLLRRIARKVVERTGAACDKSLAKAIAHGYVKEGDPSLGEKALTTAARFVIRKVAMVLDVKRSHDVFGEAIAFALALDVAVQNGALRQDTAAFVGGAIHRATESVGSAALEHVTRAGREAFKRDEEGAPKATVAQRAQRVGQAMGRQVEETRALLERAMRHELRIG